MKKTLLFLATLIVMLSGCSQQNKQNVLNFQDENITYKEVLSSKTKTTDEIGEIYKSKFDGKIVTWQGKISAYYSQSGGIKFCVVDEDHKNIDITKECDWFWAISAETSNADDYKINPSWDGNWIDYILKYYKVSFDKNKNFYNDVYIITGKIAEIDCGVIDKCAPYIDIISITK